MRYGLLMGRMLKKVVVTALVFLTIPLGGGCATVAPIRGLDRLDSLEPRATGAVFSVSLDADANTEVLSRGCSFVFVRQEDERTYEVQFPARPEIIFARLSPGRYEITRLVCADYQWAFMHRNNPIFTVFPYEISLLRGTSIVHRGDHGLNVTWMGLAQGIADRAKLHQQLPVEEQLVSGYSGKKL